MHCVNELCYILIISIFIFFFFYLHTFNPITLKQSLGQKLKLILKFSMVKTYINITYWNYMGHKRWRKDGKTFTRCYTIALKLWDKFNVNFVWLYFSSYKAIKTWPLYLKNVGKSSKVVHLRLLFTYLHQNLFNFKKHHLALVLKKIVHVVFCVFQTTLNKAINFSVNYQNESEIYKWYNVLVL